MDFNKEYLKTLAIIKSRLTPHGQKVDDAYFAKKLGKNMSYFTDKGNSKKGFSESDLLLLKHKFMA